MVRIIGRGGGTSFVLGTSSVIVSTSRAMELTSPGRMAGKFGDRLGSEIAKSTLSPGSATVVMH